jgi:hypothetical protein
MNVKEMSVNELETEYKKNKNIEVEKELQYRYNILNRSSNFEYKVN